jgi:hypothetical protein
MANKKISQLTPKGSALSATDLLEVSVDAGGGTYTTTSVTGQEIKDFVGGGNPNVISASYANGTTVTGTLLETISQSLLVPANTFTDGILEVLCRMTKTGTVGNSTMKIYKNTSNSLTGATLIGHCLTAAATNTHAIAIRSMRINSNTLTSYTTSTVSLSDYFLGTGSLVSTTFTTSVDNYILFSIQLGSLTDSANVSMARLTQYK